MKANLKIFFAIFAIVTIVAIGVLIIPTESYSQNDITKLEQENSSIVIRLTKVEERIASLEKRFEDFQNNVDKRFDNVDKRFDNVDKRFDNLHSLLLWGFGILFSGMFVIVGLIFWDRRTAISPVAKKSIELEERQERIIKAMKEFAGEDERFIDIMKRTNLW
ncbi:MAG: hypothetical protein M3R36_04465 [Bacteroidota bacterium]|nr:hypothetical protein [Bacteroidota bacterium]